MLIAVYGTLRKGDYNHERFCAPDTEPLSTERISGYEMFNLGGQYPYVAQGNGSILIEVYDLEPEVAQRIESMERGAGYDVAKVKTSAGDASLFFMPNEYHERYRNGSSRVPKILSGDWFEWLSNYKPERLAKR